MLKLAFYGKGGIGKSTTVSNIALALAEKGLKVLQIGCDPKADSTAQLLRGQKVTPVLDLIRRGLPFELSDISRKGDGGVICVEAGGPAPGVGCAGRGIIAALETLEKKGAFKEWAPDVVLYDVLGDVVCGGFAAPIRENYASHILIVTSGEKMALYAARNIHAAVQNFADRAYAKVFGLVMNRRNVENEEEKVRAFAAEEGLQIAAEIPRSNDITRCEDNGMTVIEGAPDCEAAQRFTELAQTLWKECGE